MEQAAAAKASMVVPEVELKAQTWSERGFTAPDLDEKSRCYSEAIKLKPDDPEAIFQRGLARWDMGAQVCQPIGLVVIGL